MMRYQIRKYVTCDNPDGQSSAHCTYTSREVGMPEVHYFTDSKAAAYWLEKLNEFNPSVSYGIVELDD